MWWLEGKIERLEDCREHTKKPTDNMELVISYKKIDDNEILLSGLINTDNLPEVIKDNENYLRIEKSLNEILKNNGEKKSVILAELGKRLHIAQNEFYSRGFNERHYEYWKGAKDSLQSLIDFCIKQPYRNNEILQNIKLELWGAMTQKKINKVMSMIDEALK